MTTGNNHQPHLSVDQAARLLAAARRVWEVAIVDPSRPNRVLVSKAMMDELGAVLAETY